MVRAQNILMGVCSSHQGPCAILGPLNVGSPLRRAGLPLSRSVSAYTPNHRLGGCLLDLFLSPRFV